MIRSPFSTLETRCRDLEGQVRLALAALIAAPAEHARFLNMLSLMEHIGSRKIMASQVKGALGQETLKHLAEETRHAFFFKRLAEKIARRPLNYADAVTLAAPFARAYMGRLDAAIAEETGDTGEVPYLYMSLIVELRAVWFYRLYEEALRAGKSAVALTSVLKEEELHLAAMTTQLTESDKDAPRRIALFLDIEDTRFRALWQAIEANCDGAQAAAEASFSWRANASLEKLPQDRQPRKASDPGIRE